MMITTSILLTTLAFLLQSDDPSAAQTMRPGGWAFMIIAWTCILVLVIYTFSKVLGGGRK